MALKVTCIKTCQIQDYQNKSRLSLYRIFYYSEELIWTAQNLWLGPCGPRVGHSCTRIFIYNGHCVITSVNLKWFLNYHIFSILLMLHMSNLLNCKLWLIKLFFIICVAYIQGWLTFSSTTPMFYMTLNQSNCFCLFSSLVHQLHQKICWFLKFSLCITNFDFTDTYFKLKTMLQPAFLYIQSKSLLWQDLLHALPKRH